MQAVLFYLILVRSDDTPKSENVIYHQQTLSVFHSNFQLLSLLNKLLLVDSIKAEILNQPVKIQDNKASNIFG